MKWVEEPASRVPVVREVDVAVCGGGPAGIAAALGAARAGARTLLIERYGFLGGAPTASFISMFAPGFFDGGRFIIGGVFGEIRQRLLQADALIPSLHWEPYHGEALKDAALDMLAEAGVEIMLHSLVSGALCEEGHVQACFLETKAGRQAVEARVFIDATGDADLAYLAGALCQEGRDSDGLTQPPSLMYMLVGVDAAEAAAKRPGGSRTALDGTPYYVATGLEAEIRVAMATGELTIPRDHVSAVFPVPWLPGVFLVNYSRVLDTKCADPIGLTQAEISGRQQVREGLRFLQRAVPGFGKARLAVTAPQIGIRETRRIVGEYALTGDDISSCRQFSDCIAQGCYGLDIHLPDSVGSVITAVPRGKHYDLPFRALIPRGLDNVLVAGRCISATHEALSATRVQPICIALGHAAGVGAALAAKTNGRPSQTAITDIQYELRCQGAILE